ncbi:MIP/aquaporin family protein [Catellatospora bangladeshensis]|uniref:Aquaporin n=1 Tax=Catellatospora bangladeshensis TaxID=310355 RepID=A0A8J3K029_9ACTN|nr:MIP/aquaporin family protein [Catellatospora bangladeshensis]GIF86154.1 aquaporin [Catellatospora bangladeshensis]
MAATKTNGLWRELSAEFAGTMILILFGVGVVAQVVAGGLGDHDSIAWAWGLGVTLGVYTAARISGAHINPAVTFSLAIFKGFPWVKVLPYIVAQFLGAFVAALIVRWNYTEVLHSVDPGLTMKTQGVFSTLPGNGALPIGTWGAFRDQVIGTAILMFMVLALTDLLNLPPLANLAPLLIGLLVVAIGMAWGTAAGYAINPARDFGPRLASYLTGYESAFRDQYGNLYFWVPILGPLIGGPIGAFLYQLLIGRHLTPEEITEEPAPVGTVAVKETGTGKSSDR